MNSLTSIYLYNVSLSIKFLGPVSYLSVTDLKIGSRKKQNSVMNSGEG